MSEPNELQNAGSLGNTSEVPAVTPAAAPATPAPQAVPSAQPAATAQPTQPAQANQPAQPAAAPAAQPAPSVHATLFDKILTTMGGPTTIQRRNPLTGETTTETQQSSRATLAKTILAGALTGLFAGAGAPRDAYGRPSMAAGAKQGFQAGQQMIQQRDDKAQADADADTKNKQLAFANHFELIKNMAASTAAKHASLAQMNSDSAPFIKDAHDLDAISDPKTPRAVIAENLD